MPNIFANQKDYVEKHKRNTFDLSFQNNLTFDFGELVPVFCKEVIPGDSFKIHPSFGIRLMPLVFPIQTRLNANLHFFYVRNRNLWKDWPDFIGRTKSNLVPPYLNNNNNFKTGALADYLGCPTTLVGDYGNLVRSFTGTNLTDGVSFTDLCGFLPVSGATENVIYTQPYLFGFKSTTDHSIISLSEVISRTLSNQAAYTAETLTFQQGSVRMFLTPSFDLSSLDVVNSKNLSFVQDNDIHIPGARLQFHVWVRRDNDWYPDFVLWNDWGSSPFYFTENDLNSDDEEILGRPCVRYYFDVSSLASLEFAKVDYYRSPYRVASSLQSFIDYLKDHYGSSEVRFSVLSYHSSNEEGERNSANLGFIDSLAFSVLKSDEFRGKISSIDVKFAVNQGVSDIHDFGSSINPYASHDLKISALPFRAYESIYNCFYRNQFNDPFILNGQKEYNKFIRTNEGGADNNVYQVLKRNYELDFLTSARQSPVDGDITPLVGVNKVGEFTFQNPDETTYTVKPVIGEDGHTLTGIESMEGTPANNSGLRRLVDLISIGISINDFRNVNALQRWLETNLRRGYRYKDQIMSHFGVDISYEELDMPEFIGGMSEPVIVNQVNQSVDQTGDPSGLGDFSKVLGSYAGQASVMAESKHSITKYCDEHGFIIGILSVTPVPCYSQLLPKFLVKDNVLDYYFPEFGHIGNQPISYKEVCPLQAFAAGDSLNGVFGYQRPWYDLLASVDETHADFRTSLDGFLITRLFDEKPELGKKFIEVDKDAMSNPFSVTEEGDKILGQVYFDVQAQRPIPKYGIPRLE